MPPDAGTRLAHYHLVRKLGEGGMGVVFEAEDERLGRSVAIKILPESLAGSPNRLARFEREAKLLASLNDPGIAAIYGLEASGGTRFLVLELVPGESLAARLKRGPVPVAEALGLCRQVAAALESAHERGVVHRDLKPANVAVTPEGQVKLLDFGLAKAYEPDTASGDRSQSPTVTSAGTQANVILGTAAYMSPEQARGRSVDRRSDVWSFGCLMYETLTGRQAFAGETVTDCLARILEREPDWTALPAATPAWARDLLRRCLRKDLRTRLRDIGDARIAIEEGLAGGESAAGVAPAALPGRRAIATLGLVGLAALIAGVLAGRLLPGNGGAGVPRPGSLGPAAPEVAGVGRVTHDPGISEWPTWSPDGRTLAFVSDRAGNFDIFVRRIDGGQEVNVTADPGQDYQPAFSPDGNQIAFISTRSSATGMIQIGASFGLEFRTYGGDLWTVPALGGQARRLARDANFPAWDPTGTRIAYVTGREGHRSIIEIPAEGGEPRTVLDEAASSYEMTRIRYSPAGTWVSLETAAGGIYVVQAAGGTAHQLTSGAGHAWDPTGGRLYYLQRSAAGGTRLMVVGVDEAKGQTVGAPRTISWMTGILRNLDIARDGKRIVTSQLEGSLNLTLLPLTPDGARPAGPERILNSGQVIDRYPAFSPDGRRIAYCSDRLGPMEIWIYDLPTRQQTRVKLPGADEGANLPFWTRDGRGLVVTRLIDSERQSIWMVAVDGSQAEELIPPSRGLLGGDVSRDGRGFLYESVVDGARQIFAFDFATRKSRQLTTTAVDRYEPRYALDGRSIYFMSNATGSLQLHRMPLDGGPEVALTAGQQERMRHQSFSRDGKYLYVQPSHRNVMRVPAAGGGLEPVTTFPDSGLFIEEPTVSPDGRWLAYCRSNGGSSLWMVTLAP